MLSVIFLFLAALVFGTSCYTFVPQKGENMALSTERAKYLVQSADMAYLAR